MADNVIYACNVLEGYINPLDKLEKQGDQFVVGATEIYGLLGSVRADINLNNPNWNQAWRWVQIQGPAFAPVGPFAVPVRGRTLEKGYGGKKLEDLKNELYEYQKKMQNELRLLQSSIELPGGSRQVPSQ